MVKKSAITFLLGMIIIGSTFLLPNIANAKSQCVQLADMVYAITVARDNGVSEQFALDQAEKSFANNPNKETVKNVIDLLYHNPSVTPELAYDTMINVCK